MHFNFARSYSILRLAKRSNFRVAAYPWHCAIVVSSFVCFEPSVKVVKHGDRIHRNSAISAQLSIEFANPKLNRRMVQARR